MKKPSINDTRKGRVDTFPFDVQLSFLQGEFAKAMKEKNGTRVIMILSVTESVKTAREHNLNCRRIEK